MKKENHLPVIILMGALLIMLAYSSGSKINKDTLNQIKNTPKATRNITGIDTQIEEETTSYNEPITRRADTEIITAQKTKCKEDGLKLSLNYQTVNGAPNIFGYRPVWSQPQYHFNRKLDTCLAYIAFSQQANKTEDNSAIETNIWNFIFDVYSYQAVVQNGFERTQNAETTFKEGIYKYIPNINSDQFSAKFKTLMNE